MCLRVKSQSPTKAVADGQRQKVKGVPENKLELHNDKFVADCELTGCRS